MNITFRNLISTLLLTISLPTLADTASSSALVFEQVDPIAEQNRLLEKFAVDKERLTSAISNTKSQILRSQSKPYLPELYLRLAELYIEKARVSYMEKRVTQGPNGSPLSTLEAENLKIQAVETYQRILNVYPDFDQLDKVHFYLAHEYKELKKPAEMVSEYESLIAKYPKSQYTPEAYLLLADHFVSNGESDKSESYYQRVLQYTQSPARIIARYKLAWVHINRKEFTKAVSLLEASVNDASTSQKIDIDSYDALDIRLESLMDLAFIYPDRFKNPEPEHAINYFSKLAWSRSSYLAVLEKLGLRLKVKNHWSAALSVYRELAQLTNDPEDMIQISDAFFEAYDKARSINANASHATDKDVEALIRAIRFQQNSVDIELDEKEKAFNRFEQYTRDISTKLHTLAKATKKKADYFTASQAYKHYLSFYHETKYGLAIQKNYASTLYNAGDFFNAGKQFEQISLIETLTAAQQDTYLYNATQSYYQALQSTESLNLYKTTQARAGLIATGEKHIRDFSTSQHTKKIAFNIAWAKYNEGKFLEAAALLHSFVLKYPSDTLTDAAIETLVDAYQVIEDFASLQKIATQLAATPSLSAKNKQELERVALVSQSKIVSTMTASALDNWDEGKEQLLAYAEQHESSALGEQALLSLIASSQEKNDLATMQVSASNFLRKYPSSDQADSTAKMLIDSQLKSVQFRPLIESLANYPLINKSEGKDFLFQAAQLAGRMGSSESSNTLFKQWIKDYKPTAAQLSIVVWNMTQNELRRGNQKAALETALAYRSSLPSAHRVHTDSLAGLIFAQNDDLNNATKLYQSALKSTGGQATANPQANTLIAELGLRVNNPVYSSYQAITLANGIDSALIEKKSALMAQLEAAYQTTLAFKSAEQSAKALLMLAAVNNEFADFLINAPVPSELSGNDKNEYIALIAEQAKPYQGSANEYQQAAQQLIKEQGILNRALNQYQQGPWKDESYLDKPRFTKTNSAVNSMTDENILAQHEKIMALPSQFDGRNTLIQTYIIAQDYGQALLIAESSLEQMAGLKAREKSALQNYAAVSLLSMGNTEEAYILFQSALATSNNNSAARANISALLLEFGAQPAASNYSNGLDKSWEKDVDPTQLIDLVANHKRNF